MTTPSPEEFLKEKSMSTEIIKNGMPSHAKFLTLKAAQEYAELYHQHQLAQAARELPRFFAILLGDNAHGHAIELESHNVGDLVKYDDCALIIARMQQEAQTEAIEFKVWCDGNGWVFNSVRRVFEIYDDFLYKDDSLPDEMHPADLYRQFRAEKDGGKG